MIGASLCHNFACFTFTDSATAGESNITIASPIPLNFGTANNYSAIEAARPIRRFNVIMA